MASDDLLTREQIIEIIDGLTDRSGRLIRWGDVRETTDAEVVALARTALTAIEDRNAAVNAFLAYGRHSSGCDVSAWDGKPPRPECTCRYDKTSRELQAVWSEATNE